MQFLQRSLSHARNKNGGAFRPRRLCKLTSTGLLQVVGNRREGRVQLGADALHGSDRGNGDESGDKAILDRGRAAAVVHQFGKTLDHCDSPLAASAAQRPLPQYIAVSVENLRRQG